MYDFNKSESNLVCPYCGSIFIDPYTDECLNCGEFVESVYFISDEEELFDKPISGRSL